MPVYNREEYVQAAIKSILYQTHSNLEIIVLDDGSTDNTLSILLRESDRDPRIKVLHHRQNCGVITSLTTCLKHSRGQFIARMDSDDISLPDRLYTQLAYLKENQDVGVVGTNYRRFTNSGLLISPSSPNPTSSGLIWWKMFFFPSIVHPSILARRDIFACFNESGLESTFQHAEDHAFWLRIGFKTKFANVPDILFLFRKHDNRVSTMHRKEQLSNSLRATQRGLKIALRKDVSLKAIEFLKFRHRASEKVLTEASGVILQLYFWFLINIPLTKHDKTVIRQDVAEILTSALATSTGI